MTVLELKEYLNNFSEDTDIIMSCGYYSPTGESMVAESPLTEDDISLCIDEVVVEFDISR